MFPLCNSLNIFVPVHFKSACLIIVVVIAQIHFGNTTGYQQQQTSRNNEDYNVPANYMFKYAVQAGQYNNEFGHEEERNGKQTRGQYRVKLPDGRLQIVTYTADENGYKADVTYQPASGFGVGGGGGGSGNRHSSSDSYAAATNHANSGGYGQPQTQPQNQYQQSQGQSQSYGTPSNSWQNDAGSNSGSFMMQRRKINGRTYSFDTKY